MNYVRLYADEAGESHFEDMVETLSPADFAPPAPALFASEPREAARCLFIRIPPGWRGGWHPAPKRQFFFCLAGEFEIETSDGERRVFTAGDAILGEDTSGKGHDSRALGGADVTAAVVQLD